MKVSKARKVVGIDLAGSPARETGFCVMDEKLNVKTCILHSDKELIEMINTIKPKPAVIAIDAPLSLPLGRKSLKKPKGKGIHFRQCDLELKKLHIKFFPITLGPMRMLTARGMKLKQQLKNYKVIEVYPGGAYDILKIPRKPKEKLFKGLKKLKIKVRQAMTKDELDAATCAFVGLLYMKKHFVALGNPKEGLLILPKPHKIK